MTIRLFFAATLFLFAPRLAWAQQLTATVDRNQVRMGESVELVVTYTGSGNVRIGSPEGDDFAVVGELTSSSFSYSGRVATAQIQKSFTLTPLREGTLTVGRVAVQTEMGLSYTDPLTVTVAGSGSGANPTGAGPPSQGAAPTRPTQSASTESDAMGARGMVPLPSSGAMFRGAVPAQPTGRPFIVAQVSDDSPVVGQQIVIDYLLYTPAMLLSLQALDMVEPPFDDFWFRDITDDRQGRRNRMSEVVGGEIFDVQVLRSYVAVPLSAGSLTVPPITLTLVTSARQRSGVAVASSPLLLDVQPVPEQGRPDGFVESNVGTVQLTLSAPTTTARVGDPLTFTLTANGVALASGLVLPTVTAPDGMRLIEGATESDMSPDASGWLRATVSRQFTLVAQREGSFELPSLTMSFYEPLEGTFTTAGTQAVTISIEGTSPGASVGQADGSGEAEEVELWHNALPAERAWDPDVRSGIDAFRPSRLYALGLLAPPMAWVVAALAGIVARRRAATAPARARRSAGPTALSALRTSGDDPAELIRIVRAYLAELADQPLGGASRTELAAVAGRLLGDAAAELVAVVDAAELCRYSGQSDPQLKPRARAAIEAAEEARR